MKNRIIIGIFILCLPFICYAANNPDDNTYETPARLFHIARSVNKNLVCYDVNLQNGKINSKAPFKVYWVNREEHPGKTNGLSYIQRKLAYGYKVVSTSGNRCVCTLSAYPKRPLTLTHKTTGYVCLVKINNETAVLQSLYVKAHPHNPLKVEYVELRGTSLTTHEPVTEKVKN